jgi:hypothetical protein
MPVGGDAVVGCIDASDMEAPWATSLEGGENTIDLLHNPHPRAEFTHDTEELINEGEVARLRLGVGLREALAWGRTDNNIGSAVAIGPPVSDVLDENGRTNVVEIDAGGLGVIVQSHDDLEAGLLEAQ